MKSPEAIAESAARRVFDTHHVVKDVSLVHTPLDEGNEFAQRVPADFEKHMGFKIEVQNPDVDDTATEFLLPSSEFVAALNSLQPEGALQIDAVLFASAMHELWEERFVEVMAV